MSEQSVQTVRVFAHFVQNRLKTLDGALRGAERPVGYHLNQLQGALLFSLRQRLPQQFAPHKLMVNTHR